MYQVSPMNWLQIFFSIMLLMIYLFKFLFLFEKSIKNNFVLMKIYVK